jgi:hydroxymethylglutaryl-CoA lyase
MTGSVPARVAIHEVGPREGFQSESPPIPTEQKIELANALSETGLRSIELVAFVSPKWVPQMADAEEVLRGITRAPGVRYTGIFLNVQGLKRALASDCYVEGSLSLSASETFSKRNTNKTTDESLAELPAFVETYQDAQIPVERVLISAAFGCNFEGYISLERVLDCIRRVRDLAAERGETIRSVKLLDTMGWANPEQIRRTIHAVRSRWPELSVALHLHDTRGLGLANAAAALHEGVTEFDSAVAGMGGCPFAAVKGAPGNISTEDFAFLCEQLGIETGLDLDRLVACVDLAERIFGRALPGHLAKGGLFRTLRPTGWAPSLAAVPSGAP